MGSPIARQDMGGLPVRPLRRGSAPAGGQWSTYMYTGAKQFAELRPIGVQVGEAMPIAYA
jgi:hypothetical protein